MRWHDFYMAVIDLEKSWPWTSPMSHRLHDFELKVGLSTPAASDWPSSQVVKYTYAVYTTFVYILSMLLPILPQVLEVSCPRKGYSGTIDSKAGDSNFTSPLSSLNTKMMPWQNLYGFFSMMRQLFKKSFNLKLEHLNLVFRMTWRLQSVQGLLHVNLPHAKDSEIQVSMLNCYELLCCSTDFHENNDEVFAFL